MQESVKVDSKLQLLDELVNSLVSIDVSRFISFNNAYVYPEALQCTKQIIYRGDEYVDFDTGAIVHLNLPEQLYIYQRIAGKHGIKARHGTMKETLEAAWSDETKEFKEKVLRYWLYNSEVIKKLSKSYDVSRAIGMEYREVKSLDIMCEREGKLLETEGVSVNEVPVIKLGRILQTSIPTISGFYSEFAGVIPLDKELGSRNEKSRGDFGHIYFDKNGLSAVGSLWDAGVGTFATYAYEPMRAVRDAAVGLWTDEDPKK
ncbi:MAG: hypothetical protein ACE5J2_05675 [Nitrososphaerales archaeon]